MQVRVSQWLADLCCVGGVHDRPPPIDRLAVWNNKQAHRIQTQEPRKNEKNETRECGRGAHARGKAEAGARAAGGGDLSDFKRKRVSFMHTKHQLGKIIFFIIRGDWKDGSGRVEREKRKCAVSADRLAVKEAG